MIKRSKQRDAIQQCLIGRYDHPTAETVYMDIKDEFPNISLGTVYRNLSLLADLGEIQKLTVSGGPDRFDGNPKPHYHFGCRSCGCVMDLDLPQQDALNQLAAEHFDGIIEKRIVPELREKTNKLNNIKEDMNYGKMGMYSMWLHL